MDHQRVNRYHPPIVCDKCKNTYASKQSLSNHKRKCNGPKVHFCDNCKETFTSSQGLSNHKRWKCSLHPIVSAAGVDLQQQKVESINKRQKKANIDGNDSISLILKRIINPWIATPTKEQRNEDKENKVTTIIKNLSGTRKPV